MKLASLASWKETSAVTRGAVTRAHILSEKELRLATQSGEINLAAHADDDKLLLVTLQDGDNNPVFDGNVPTDQGNGNNKMTEITLSLEKYDALVVAQGKVDSAEAKFAASEQARIDAEAKFAAAEQAKETAETAKAAVDTQLNEANEKVTQLTAQLAAATTGAGDKGKGVGTDGAEGDEPEANLANSVNGLDTSYFKVNR